MFQYFVRFLKISLGSLVISIASNPTLLTAHSAPLSTINERGSYIGIGGAIGLNGNTSALGTGGLTILTKVGFTENLSLHDATIIFGSNARFSRWLKT